MVIAGSIPAASAKMSKSKWRSNPNWQGSGLENHQ